MHILGPTQVAAHPHDARPLHRLDRIKRTQLRLPDLMHRSTRRVIQAVGKTKVLADENDRVAAQQLCEVERQMRDGRASLDLGHRPDHIAQQFVVKVIGANAHWAEVGSDNRGVALGLGHKRHIRQIGQVFVKPRADRRVVQRRNKVRPNPTLQHRLKRRLHPDDNNVLPHLRVRK